MAFFLNQCYGPLFAEFSGVLRQKRPCFRQFFSEKIEKIIL
jgi:hypothetical protein